MIEPTDEMLAAYEVAAERVFGQPTQGSLVALAAVLAIVERDYAPLADALVAVHRAMATDSRDWSIGRGDSWLYGVLVGWECDEPHEHDEIDCNGSLDEMATRHGWTPAHIDRIRQFRRAIRKASAL